MLLGTIMKDLQNEDVAAAALLSLGDIVLMAEVEAARAPHDEDVGAYVSGAAQRFARFASDDDWLQLMTVLETSDRPAASCLTAMLRWSISRDARGGPNDLVGGTCSCGGGEGSCHDQA